MSKASQAETGFYFGHLPLGILESVLAEHLVLDPKLRGMAFNFSNEEPLSVLDLAKTILRKMKSRLQLEIHNQAINEIREQFLSSERARRVLNWRPQFTLEEGLDRTIAWYRRVLAQ